MPKVKLKPTSVIPPLLIGIDGNEANVTRRVGSNVYAYYLLKALYQLKTNHTFIIYLKNPPLADFPVPHENWQYRVMPMARLWSQVRLPWELWTTSNRPDVFLSPGHYISPLIPTPVVISILDLAYLTHPEFFRQSDLLQLRTWTQRSINKTSHILTISQSTKNDIPKYYQFDDEKITVTYPGINSERYFFPQNDGDISRVKKQYGINKDYFLYVGTLQPRKNLDGLVKAFASLKTNNYQLVIAGKKGWMYEDLFQLVEKMKLQRRVIFTDFVPDEDLPPLMAGARCLVQVSFYEGFGIPVAEALAVGTPAVVSGVSSLPEVLGGAGFKVDPNNLKSIANGLKKMMELNQTDYTNLVDKAITHAAMFRWDRAAAQTLEAVERVFMEKNPIA